jgi:hypothetical protein
MKHRSLIFGIIAVLVLGLIGYGYAAWSATVTTTASVSTGTFKLGIAIPVGGGTTDESGTKDLTWNGDTAGTVYSAYDVGSLTDANGLIGATGFASSTYYTGVTETYNNVYPDYQAGYTVDIDNGGTIPIDLQTPLIEWTGDSDSSVASDYTVYSWALTDTTPSTPAVLASGTTSDDMSAIGGTILPAGDVATLTVNAYFTDGIATLYPDGLAQGATGTQTISITGVQFNH